MHVSARLKRRAGRPPPAALGEALGLRALTARVREDPPDIGRYYQRRCRLLQLKPYAEAARDADACLKLQPSFAKATLPRAAPSTSYRSTRRRSRSTTGSG